MMYLLCCSVEGYCFFLLIQCPSNFDLSNNIFKLFYGSCNVAETRVKFVFNWSSGLTLIHILSRFKKKILMQIDLDN